MPEGSQVFIRLGNETTYFRILPGLRQLAYDPRLSEDSGRKSVRRREMTEEVGKIDG